MVKWCLMANLEFDTETKRDNFMGAVKSFLAGKPRWKQFVEMKEVMTENDLEYVRPEPIAGPSLFVLVRFNIRGDMNDVFQRAKTKLQSLTGVHGSVSVHKCTHDIPPFKPCVIEKEIVI